MRLGIIQNNYSADGFDIVKSSDLKFIEICCNFDNEVEQLISNKEQIKRQIERTGIDVSSVGRWNHNLNENGSINNEKATMYYDLLDAAIYLGAKTFVCGMNYDESISLYKNYQNAISFFGELIKRANGKIKIAIQNCNWNNFVVSPREWEVVLGELPELMIKYDASHAYNRNEDYLGQLNDWCDRVAHIHIKGTTHAGKKAVADPPAGMDDILWRPLFSILYSNGYDGDLSIEPHSKIWKGELGAAGVTFTIDFIKQFILK